MMSEGVYAVIIEDDELGVKVLQGLLDGQGIRSEVVMSYEDVHVRLDALVHPGVVFIDLEMPEVDGYEVLAIVRGKPNFDGVPVIAYTTHISHMKDTRTAGFDGFLGKPVDPVRFPEHIQQILGGQEVWEAP